MDPVKKKRAAKREFDLNSKKRSRPDFAPGDIVLLKCGGPPMVVEVIEPPTSSNPGWGVKCAWFVRDGNATSEMFHAETLVKTTPELALAHRFNIDVGVAR